MPTLVSCPSCQQPLNPPAAACASCGLPLTGQHAAALWQVDQEIAALQANREKLLDALRASAPPHAAVGASTGIRTWRLATSADPQHPTSGEAEAVHRDAQGTSGPTTPRPAVSRSGPDRHRDTWHGQQILLAAGALLVLTAAVVFLAVSWSVIGVNGQVTVMALATVLAGAACFRAARRGLRATAEALAVLTVGLAVVDVSAAYALNLAGLHDVDFDSYSAVAAVVLAVGFAAVGSQQRNLRTFPIAAVMALSVAPALTVAALSPVESVAAILCFAAAELFVVVRQLAGRWWSFARLPLLVVAGAYLLATWALAIPDVYLSPFLGAGGAGAVIALAAAAVTGWRAGLHRSLAAARMHPLMAASALAAAALTVTGLVRNADDTGVAGCGAVVLAAAAAGYLAWTRRALGQHPLGVVALALQLVAAFGLLAAALSDQGDFGRHSDSWVALTAALVVTAVSAAATSRRQLRVRVLASGYTAGLALTAAYTASGPSGPVVTVIAITVVALSLALLAARCGDQTLEIVLASFAAVGMLGAAGVGVGHGARLLAFVLAAVGLAALAYGTLPRRGNVALLGVAGCSAATWVLLLDSNVRVVEAYSLPLAALIALVGLVRLHREPSTPSWLTLGPALSAALLPSAFVSTTDDFLFRPLIVLAVGAFVLVAGVMTRWQSPVVVGSVTVLIVTVAQLAPYADSLPRWLTFGTLGLLLLVLGARYEQRRQNARQAARWVAALR